MFLMIVFRENASIIWKEFEKLGFQTSGLVLKIIFQHSLQFSSFPSLLPRSISSHIITTYRFPSHPNFSFEKLYSGLRFSTWMFVNTPSSLTLVLSEKGCNIYPGKVTNTPCFRIGHIGHLYAKGPSFLLFSYHFFIHSFCRYVPVSGRNKGGAEVFFMSKISKESDDFIPAKWTSPFPCHLLRTFNLLSFLNCEP